MHPPNAITQMEPTEKITIQKAKQQSKLLATSPASLKQKIKILNTMIKPYIAYVYLAIPFSNPDIEKLDKTN